MITPLHSYAAPYPCIAPHLYVEGSVTNHRGIGGQHISQFAKAFYRGRIGFVRNHVLTGHNVINIAQHPQLLEQATH